MIFRYSEKHLNEESAAIVKFIIILDLLIFVAVAMLLYEGVIGVWCLTLIIILLIVFNYGSVSISKKQNKKERLKTHTLEVKDQKVMFSWADSKSDILINEVDKVFVKKSNKDISNIRLRTKSGREIDLRGYNSMPDLLDELIKVVDSQNIYYEKWYKFSDF